MVMIRAETQAFPLLSGGRVPRIGQLSFLAGDNACHPFPSHTTTGRPQRSLSGSFRGVFPVGGMGSVFGQPMRTPNV